MSTPDSLTLVTDRDESLRVFEAFEMTFAVNARLFRNHSLGWQGGSVQIDVHWHESAKIWGVFERSPPRAGKGGDRFWNCFGVVDPGNKLMLSITVEINPPHQGENRRTAGVFLRDDKGRYHVGHSGKVGGGRPGVGQRAFREFSRQLLWQEVSTPRGSRQVVVFGPLNDQLFANLLAPFIHLVAEFKEHVTLRR